MKKAKFIKGSGTDIDPSANLREWAIVGDNVHIGKNSVIERSVIWSDTCVGDEVLIKDSVVTPLHTVIK